MLPHCFLEWFSVRNLLLISLRWPFFNVMTRFLLAALKMLFVVGILQFDYDVSRYESPWVYPTWSFLSFLNMYINVCHKIGVILRDYWASLIAQLVKNLPAMQETLVWFLGGEDPLEKGNATHSSILGLPWWLSWLKICLQCGRPGFDRWVGKHLWRRELLPTPVFWPGEFNGLYSPWGRKESDMTEWPLLSPEDPRRQSIDLTAEVPVGLTKEGLFTSLS